MTSNVAYERSFAELSNGHEFSIVRFFTLAKNHQNKLFRFFFCAIVSSKKAKKQQKKKRFFSKKLQTLFLKKIEKTIKKYDNSKNTYV